MYISFQYLLRLTRCADITFNVRTVVFNLKLFGLQISKPLTHSDTLVCAYFCVCVYVIIGAHRFCFFILYLKKMC